MTKRISFDEYFFRIVSVVSERSTCLRRQFGALLVRDNNILSSGMNGAPSGCSHCLDIGCLRQTLGIQSGKNMELCRASHAEVNAIVQAAKHGISIKGAVLYTQSNPCGYCAKAIINAGIQEVKYLNDDYPDKLGKELIEESGKVKLTKVTLDPEKDFEYRLP